MFASMPRMFRGMFKPSKPNLAIARIELNVQSGLSSQTRCPHLKAFLPQNVKRRVAIQTADGRPGDRLRLAKEHVGTTKDLYLDFRPMSAQFIEFAC